MNWVTTNIRIPEDLYMDLKINAARQRKSVAAVIRGRLSEKITDQKTTNVMKMMKDLGKKIAKDHKGLNITKGLIELRYEQ